MSAPRGPWPNTAPPALPRPHEVQVAVYLWLASLVVGVVGTVTSFGSLGPQVRAELTKQAANNPDLASMNQDTIVRIAGVAVVVASLVGVAIRVFLIVKLAGGRRWARTILTVLGVLSVAAAVLGVRSAGAVDAALSVVNALLTAGAVVYLYSDGARAYFAPRPPR